MAKAIINDWFVCAKCKIETSEGYEHQGKKYCVDCFKKVKKETTNVKTKINK